MSYIRLDGVGSNSLDRVNKILATFPKGAFKATYSALKRAGATAKTQAGRFASAQYTITKGDFMKNVNSKTRLEGNSNGVASMSIMYGGNVLPLLTFNTSYSKDGMIQTQIKRGDSTYALERAFTAKIYGPLKVFERVGSDRFPLEQKFGPSTAHMMQNDEVIKQMDETIRKTYDERIEHEILRVMNGW